MKILPVILACALCAFGVDPSAAQESEAENVIVVTAPSGLSEKDLQRWEKLNDRAIKLKKSLDKLELERLDDLADVSSARSALEKAQSKLEREMRDADKTTDRIQDTLVDIEKATRDRDNIGLQVGD